MLLQLHIENVAVIEQVSLDFSEGFHVLTGETGAGKSIIIDALNAVTGERTSKDIIRTGADKAKITAVFGQLSQAVEERLIEIGLAVSEDGIFMLCRELSTDGRSVFRINGVVVPMAMVRQVGPLLINIHGQHDSQQLFSPAKHLTFIDDFGALSDEVSAYQSVYHELRRVEQALQETETDDALKNRKMELLQFQLEEIEAAALTDGEEESLLSRRDCIRNAEELSENTAFAHQQLGGDETGDGALTQLRRAADALEDCAQFLPECSDVSQRLQELYYEAEELLSEVRELENGFDFDPEELDGIEQRLDLIFKLKQKYGGSISEILEKQRKMQQELSDILHSDERALQLRNEQRVLFEKANEMAQSLSHKRVRAAEKLCTGIRQELAFLDMPAVRFKVDCRTVPLKSDGLDQMEFLISANNGEDFRPLAKIASGGELSRIMLAIKTVLSESDPTDTLIFDEIDTGVSGKTARKIGEKMRQISKRKQVLCVTHLAQIASLADCHFLIEKHADAAHTYTSVRRLDHKQRVEEIARIMGGENITEATLKAAQELMLKD